MAFGFRPPSNSFDSLVDLISARHEDEHVTAATVCMFRKCIGRQFPYRRRVIARPARQIVHTYRKGSSFRSQDHTFLRSLEPIGRPAHARREIFFQHGGFECRGHHDNAQLRPPLFLEVERPGESDVAVEVPFVKLVKDQRLNAAERRILDQLPQ